MKPKIEPGTVLVFDGVIEGEATVIARSNDGWLMARRKRCMPFVVHERAVIKGNERWKLKPEGSA